MSVSMADLSPDRDEEVQALRNAYDEILAAHAEFYLHSIQIMDRLKKANQGGLSRRDLADVGFIHREAENLLDDWRKDCKARQELIGRILCHLVMHDPQTMMSSNDDALRVRGDLCTATCDLAVFCDVPASGTPQWYAILEHYGLPPEPFLEDGIASLNWNKVKKVAIRCTEAGEPLPKGFSPPRPQHRAIYRKKRASKGDKDE